VKTLRCSMTTRSPPFSFFRSRRALNVTEEASALEETKEVLSALAKQRSLC
jgi:hypothetical protein